jgi:hypothetical protein
LLTYSFTTIFTLLNLLLSIYIFNIIPIKLFPLYFELGLITYLLLSISYFGIFSKFLQGNYYKSITLIVNTRFQVLAIPILMLLYFQFYGNIEVYYVPIILIAFLLWATSPVEILLIKKYSIKTEVIVDILRSIISLCSKFLILYYKNEYSLIFSFFAIYLYNFFVYILLEKRFDWKLGFLNILNFNFILNKCIFGIILSILLILLLKADYFLSILYKNDFSTRLTIFHKFEEINLLIISAYIPWFNRLISNNKFSIKSSFIYTLLSFTILLTGFIFCKFIFIDFLNKYLVLSGNIKILIDDYYNTIFYIITACLSCLAFILFNYVISFIDINKLIKYFIFIILIYFSLMITMLEFDNNYFYILRFIMILSIIFTYIFLIAKNKKLN